MEFYIREWTDGHATLMTVQGNVIWTFPSVEEAMEVCRDWYDIHAESSEYFTSTIS